MHREFLGPSSLKLAVSFGHGIFFVPSGSNGAVSPASSPAATFSTLHGVVFSILVGSGGGVDLAAVLSEMMGGQADQEAEGHVVEPTFYADVEYRDTTSEGLAQGKLV